MRQFDTGATRDGEVSKPDYEGYLSPTVIRRYGEYMLAHQQTPEGVRESDNWQLGIPLDEYMKSLLRHCFDLWLWHRTECEKNPEDLACAIIFNASGYLHELLKKKLPANLSLNPPLSPQGETSPYSETNTHPKWAPPSP